LNLEIIWRFSGDFLESFWRFSGIFLEILWRLSGIFLEIIWNRVFILGCGGYTMIVAHFNFQGVPEPASPLSIEDGSLSLLPGTPDINVLYTAPFEVRASTMVSLASTYTGTAVMGLFLSIDGILSYYDGETWKPLPKNLSPLQLAPYALPGPSLSVEAAAAAIGPDKLSTISPVFMFGGTDLFLSGFTVGFEQHEESYSVHVTKVKGKMLPGSRPRTFRVMQNQPLFMYRTSLLLRQTHTISVASDGSWEVDLPDTDSVGTIGAYYAFMFDDAAPQLRKVPKVGEIDFGQLPT
jgi:hypothetical protein